MWSCLPLHVHCMRGGRCEEDHCGAWYCINSFVSVLGQFQLITDHVFERGKEPVVGQQQDILIEYRTGTPEMRMVMTLMLYPLQELHTQDNEELLVHLLLFEEYAEEDSAELKNRFEEIRIEMEYPSSEQLEERCANFRL